MRSRRHCLGAEPGRTVSDVAGLAQVVLAVELLLKMKTGAASVSVSTGDTDEQLIALSEEAAAEAGLRMDVSRDGAMLVLRFDTGRAD